MPAFLGGQSLVLQRHMRHDVHLAFMGAVSRRIQEEVREEIIGLKTAKKSKVSIVLAFFNENFGYLLKTASQKRKFTT